VLAQIALRDIDNPQIVGAVVSSSSHHAAELVRNTVRTAKPTRASSDLLAKLLRSSFRNDESAVLAAAFHELSRGDEARFAWRCWIVGGFLNALDDAASTLTDLRREGDPAVQRSIDSLADLFSLARQRASDPAAPMPDRLAAMQLLGRGLTGRGEDARRLSHLLAPTNPLPIQLQAVQSLSRLNRSETADWLLQDWSTRGPRVRTAILETFFSRREWTHSLIKAIEAKRVAASQLTLPQRERLLLHYYADIRKVASRVLKDTTSDSNSSIQAAFQAVSERTGDSTRGAALFAKHCLSCHAIDSLRRAGPPLSLLQGQPPERLLTSILKPSQVVEPAYVAYTAVMNSGRLVSGVVSSEAGASIRMISADGKQHVLLRADLETLQASSLSLMPEGFSRVLPSPQDLADLIACIRAKNAAELVSLANKTSRAVQAGAAKP